METDQKMENNIISLIDQDNQEEVEDNNVIILDDDDFIQTTFNLLNTSASSSMNTPLVNNHDLSVNKTSHNSIATTNATFLDLEAPNKQISSASNILIDLTCDDFDLNDLFMLHSNNEYNLAIQNQANSQIDAFNSSNLKIKADCTFSPQEQVTIKNEFDFKVFNFNIKDFTSCIEEILIDDDNEEVMANEVNNQHLERVETNKELEARETDLSTLNSFSKYRITNDSSSDTSCTTKKSGNIYKCDQCAKTFNKSYNFKRHMIVHTSKEAGENSLKRGKECPNCKRRILDKSNFSKHVKICNKKILTKKVKYFSYPSDDTENLSKHSIHEQSCLKVIANKCAKPKVVKLYECEICKKVFNKKFNYHRHIRMHFLNEIMNHQHDPTNEYHSSIINASLDNAESLKHEFFECNFCFRKFNEKKQLAFHQQKWHLNVYECDYCFNNNKKQVFSGKFDYIKHLNLFHKMSFKFKCKYCYKHFKYLSLYIQHRQTHLSNNSNLNLQLNNSELKGENENDEEDILLNEKLNKCHVCGKRFSSFFNLKRHAISIHENQEKEVLEKDKPNTISSESYKLRLDCNTNQKSFYERNKLNFHLNKIQINK